MKVTIQKWNRNKDGDLEVTREHIEEVAHVEPDYSKNEQEGFVTVYGHDSTEFWCLILDKELVNKIKEM